MVLRFRVTDRILGCSAASIRQELSKNRDGRPLKIKTKKNYEKKNAFITQVGAYATLIRRSV
jgi:hypothetical protein